MSKLYKRHTVISQKKVGVGKCEHRVAVTKIGDGYNIRVFLNEELNQESRVYDRMFIQPEAKEMLRWEHKMGNYSDYADKARHRNKPQE